MWASFEEPFISEIPSLDGAKTTKTSPRTSNDDLMKKSENKHESSNRGGAMFFQGEEEENQSTSPPTPTGVGSTSEEDHSTSSNTTGTVLSSQAGWLGGIGVDIQTLAVSLRDTAGDVASFVQQSALAVAAEITQLEEADSIEIGSEGFKNNNENNRGSTAPATVVPLRFPWEITIDKNDGTYFTDEVLKEKILKLSTQDKTFLEPYSPKTFASTVCTTFMDNQHQNDKEEEESFRLDEPRVQLIRSLLEIDEKLATTHARLSGRSAIREVAFWKNYFYCCDRVRQDHLEQFEGRRSKDEQDYSEEYNKQQLNFATHDSEKDEQSSGISSQNSLVPADNLSAEEDVAEQFDDSSFVCVDSQTPPSPPTSMNSTGIHSVDSLVFVEQGTLRP